MIYFNKSYQVESFLDKILVDKTVLFEASKEVLVWALPFSCKRFLQSRSRLVTSVKKNLRDCNLKAVCQSSYNLCALFELKCTLDQKIPSDIVYRYTNSKCKFTYYCKAYRQKNLFKCERASHFLITFCGVTVNWFW